MLGFGEAIWDPAEQRRTNAFLKGRTQNTQRYKPGTQEVLLVFSDKRGNAVYRFPYYDRFRHVLEPLLEQVSCSKFLGLAHGIHSLVCPGASLLVVAA